MSQVVILGAGLAGLSAAYHLDPKHTYTILESENRVGGLCRTETINGFTFDYTGHFLHFKKDEVKKLVKDLMGDDLQQHERKSGIFLDQVITPYPFQLYTHGHKAELIKECLMGMIKAKYESNDRQVNNFEDWILKTCGEGVAKHFMIPYNTKLWTVHPREMTTDWMGGYVPVPEIDKAIEGALKAPLGSIGYNAHFYYTKKGGIEALPRSFLPFVKNLKLNTRVTKINLKDKTVETDRGTFQFDHLISTLPLKNFVTLCQDLDPNLELPNAASSLRHNSVFTLNLGINRPSLSPYHWLYFPEEKYIFYRIGFPSQLSESMAPKGMSSACVEISYTKPFENEETIVNQVIDDFIKAGLIDHKNEVVSTQIIKIPVAYVIYDHNRQKMVTKLQEELRKHQIYSIGRYGNWEYSAMEDAIYQGKQTAQNL